MATSNPESQSRFQSPPPPPKPNPVHLQIQIRPRLQQLRNLRNAFLREAPSAKLLLHLNLLRRTGRLLLVLPLTQRNLPSRSPGHGPRLRKRSNTLHRQESPGPRVGKKQQHELEEGEEEHERSVSPVLPETASPISSFTPINTPRSRLAAVVIETTSAKNTSDEALTKGLGRRRTK